MLVFLDLFFTVFHTLFILFNLCGWILTKTRKLHLFTVSLTLLSWLGLGYFYGWGYCFLTDWHYDVLHQLGHQDLPRSYITFLIERVLGFRPNDSLVISLTGWVFAGVALITYGLALRQWITNRD